MAIVARPGAAAAGTGSGAVWGDSMPHIGRAIKRLVGGTAEFISGRAGGVPVRTTVARSCTDADVSRVSWSRAGRRAGAG